ncbi:hypothetical protein G7046_g888 [Stylonectria norvegica]|nr:hypothetical protein G7046_g888 [Stylonectria norvegica]
MATAKTSDASYPMPLQQGQLDVDFEKHMQVEMKVLNEEKKAKDIQEVDHHSSSKKTLLFLPPTPTDKSLLCKDVLSPGQHWSSLDGNATDGCTSDSEPGFTSDSEPWTDEDEDNSDESVLCLTSHGTRPLDTTDTLRPILPRRLSFKPLERVDDQATSSQKHNDDYAAILNGREYPATLVLPSDISPGELYRNDYFVVTRSNIAGWGAFAAKDLKYGETIHSEVPLLLADSTSPFQEFHKLDRFHQRILLSLHANHLCKYGTERFMAIWTTNSFATSRDGEAGVFPIAARFNHACYPKCNIEYFFNKALGLLEMVVAADEIKAGEELTISYGKGRTPMDLYLTYGFRCHCGGCAGLSEDEINELTSQW